MIKLDRSIFGTAFFLLYNLLVALYVALSAAFDSGLLSVLNPHFVVTIIGN